MKARLATLLVSVVLGLTLLNVIFYLRQSSMVFHPDPRITSVPEDWGMRYTPVSLNTEDGVRISGWYIPAAGAQRTVLFFHGNAGNISHRRTSIALFNKLGLNVFIIDYRGYGGSEGRPNETGLYYDGLAAWRYLTEDRAEAPENIVLFGRSLGGAVAAHIAMQKSAGATILESTFSSAAAMGRVVMPLLAPVLLMRYRFDTLAKVRSICSPLMVIHSSGDDIIPFQQGREIYQAAREPKVFLELTGDHNSGVIQNMAVYTEELRKFLTDKTMTSRCHGAG